MEKKKIAIVVSHLGLGGAERVTSVLANSLAQRGHEIYLIVFSGKYSDYSVDKSVRTVYIPEHKGKLENIRKQLRFYRNELRRIDPEWIIALSMHRYIMLSGTLRKYKYIMSERNDPTKQNMIDAVTNKYVFKHSAKVVFQTKDAREYYSKLNAANVRIIPNPIKENLPSVYIGNREKRVVAFSRLSKQKNIPLLLRAFARFLKIYPHYILEIYGEGECLVELESLSNSLGISNSVIFKGYSNKIHEEIINAGFFVSSSDYEGISNSMIEAMGMGLPVICTDCPCGGARMMIIDTVNGCLVPVGDEEALYNKMCFLASNPKEANKMGIEAAKIREILSADKIVSQWEMLMI